MRFIHYFLFLLLCGSLVLGSCKGSESARQNRYNKKQEEIMLKQMKKEYEYALKRHHEMQSERTLDMMLSSKKSSKSLNKKRKKGLFRAAGSCKSNKPVGLKNDGN
jgi:hypothetical protein